MMTLKSQEFFLIIGVNCFQSQLSPPPPKKKKPKPIRKVPCKRQSPDGLNVLSKHSRTEDPAEGQDALSLQVPVVRHTRSSPGTPSQHGRPGST